jgi:hypothetical protein
MGGIGDAFLVKFAPTGLHVTAPSFLPIADLQMPYSYQLQAEGGMPPYRWQAVGFQLPDGLVLSASGVLQGTARNPQTETSGYQFTAKVTDGAGAVAYKSVFVNIRYPGNPVCDATRCILRVIIGQGFLYEAPFLMRGISPFTLSVAGTLPPGITIDSVTGDVGGTPISAGTFIFSMTIRDAVGARGTRTWEVTVSDPNAPPPSPPPPASGGSGGGGGGIGALTMLALLFAARKRLHLGNGASR